MADKYIASSGRPAGVRICGGLQRLGEIEIDPVLVSPFRSHPLSFQILHEGRLHLEAANGEIGSLYPLLLVKRLDGCCLHKVHQAE